MFIAVGAWVIFLFLYAASYISGNVVEMRVVGKGGQVIVETCIREYGPWGCFSKLSATAIKRPHGEQDPYISAFRHFASISDLVATCTLPRKAECGAKIVESGAFKRGEVADAIGKVE